MRIFCLGQTSRAVLLVMSAGLTLSVTTQAATVNKQATAVNSTNNNASQTTSKRLTASNSTDGIIALVNDNAILKSDLIDAINQTQLRAKAAGQPLASSAQLQSEVLNALILRELQLSLVNRVGLKPDEAAINQRLEKIAEAEGLDSLSALQQSMDTQRTFPKSKSAMSRER